VINTAEVARLLRDALSAHEAAKEARRQKRPDARDLLIQARELRIEAHRLDPDHTAPAWFEEQVITPNGKDTHRELLAFYAQQLDRVPA
jgi:hypothetical protein